jgi:hypothetical protein
MKNIEKLITQDVQTEFANLKEQLTVHFPKDFDIGITKEFLSKYIPKEIISKSENLMDNLINYLIDQSIKELEYADVDLKNKFFDMNFREKIAEWAFSLENKLSLDSDFIRYSLDPRLKQGLITGGITLLAGSLVTTTLFIPTMAISAIISGLVTIILSAVAFKLAYNKNTENSRNKVKDDVDQYLTDSQKQLIEWLNTIIKEYKKDFNEFCKTNGFRL